MEIFKLMKSCLVVLFILSFQTFSQKREKVQSITPLKSYGLNKKNTSRGTIKAATNGKIQTVNDLTVDQFKYKANCEEDYRSGNYSKLIGKSCLSNGLRKIAGQSNEDFAKFATKIDFKKKSIPLGNRELKKFYFGSKRSCLSCAGVSEKEVEKLKKDIVKYQNESSKVLGVEVLRDVVLDNMINYVGKLNRADESKAKKISCLGEIEEVFESRSCANSDGESYFKEALKLAGFTDITQMSGRKLIKMIQEQSHNVNGKKVPFKELKVNYDVHFKNILDILSKVEFKSYKKFCESDRTSVAKELNHEKLNNTGILNLDFLLSKKNICEIQENLKRKDSQALVSKLKANYKRYASDLINEKCERSVKKAKSLICKKETRITSKTFDYVQGKDESFFAKFTSKINNPQEINAVKAYICMNRSFVESGFEEFVQHESNQSNEENYKATIALASDRELIEAEWNDSKNVQSGILKISDVIEEESGKATMAFDSDADISSNSSNNNSAIDNIAYDKQAANQLAQSFGSKDFSPINSFSSAKSFYSNTRVNNEIAKVSSNAKNETTESIEDKINRILSSKNLEKDSEIQELKEKISSLEKDEKERLLLEAKEKYAKLLEENNQKDNSDVAKTPSNISQPSSVQNIQKREIASIVPSTNKKYYQNEKAQLSKSDIKSGVDDSFVSKNVSSSSSINQAFTIKDSLDNPSSSLSKTLSVALINNSASGQELEKSVSSIINKLISDGEVSKVYITSNNGVESLVFTDENKSFELNKFSSVTQRLIKEYVEFSKNKILEEKREEIVALDKLDSSEVSLNLLKKSLYEVFAKDAKIKGDKQNHHNYLLKSQKF